MATIGSLAVLLSLNSANFEKGIARSVKSAEGFTKSASKALSSVNTSSLPSFLSSVGASIGSLGGPIGTAIGAAVGMAGEQILNLKHLLNEGVVGEMRRLSRLGNMFGIGTESMSALASAANMSGIELETLTTGMAHLARVQGEVLAGEEGITRKLKIMGLDAEQF